MTSETKQDVLQIERQQSNGSDDLNKVGPMFDKKDYSGAHEVSPSILSFRFCLLEP